MPLTLDQLRRATEAGMLPADVAAEVLADFKRYVDAQGALTLEQVFGLCGPSGSDPWHAILRRERRDQALQQLAEALCPDGTTADKTDALRRRINRYLPTWRRRDQYCEEPPSPDRVDRLLFEAFQAGNGNLPDSPRQLRRIIATAADGTDEALRA